MRLPSEEWTTRLGQLFPRSTRQDFADARLAGPDEDAGRDTVVALRRHEPSQEVEEGLAEKRV
jgi:hypothetical protein